MLNMFILYHILKSVIKKYFLIIFLYFENNLLKKLSNVNNKSTQHIVCFCLIYAQLVVLTSECGMV